MKTENENGRTFVRTERAEERSDERTDDNRFAESPRADFLHVPSCGTRASSDLHNLTACDHNDAFLNQEQEDESAHGEVSSCDSLTGIRDG